MMNDKTEWICDHWDWIGVGIPGRSRGSQPLIVGRIRQGVRNLRFRRAPQQCRSRIEDNSLCVTAWQSQLRQATLRRKNQASDGNSTWMRGGSERRTQRGNKGGQTARFPICVRARSRKGRNCRIRCPVGPNFGKKWPVTCPVLVSSEKNFWEQNFKVTSHL